MSQMDNCKSSAFEVFRPQSAGGRLPVASSGPADAAQADSTFASDSTKASKALAVATKVRKHYSHKSAQSQRSSLDFVGSSVGHARQARSRQNSLDVLQFARQDTMRPQADTPCEVSARLDVRKVLTTVVRAAHSQRLLCVQESHLHCCCFQAVRSRICCITCAPSSCPLSLNASTARTRFHLDTCTPSALHPLPARHHAAQNVQASGHTVFNSRYVDVQAIGRGQYGTVRLCLDLQTQALVAVKVCPRAVLRSAPTRSRLSLDSRLTGGSRSRVFASSARTHVPRATSSSTVLSPAQAERSSSAANPRAVAPVARVPAPVAGASMGAPRAKVAKRASGAGDSHFTSASDASAATGATLGAFAPCAAPAPAPTPLDTLVAQRRGSIDIPCVAAAPAPVSPAATPLAQEIEVLKGLRHPNIVRLAAAMDDPSADDIVLVMEHVAGGTLEPARHRDGRWQRQPEASVRSWLRDVAHALQYLDEQGVAHGDVKPANLLRASDGSVKLADFGSAAFCRGHDTEVRAAAAWRPLSLAPRFGRFERKFRSVHLAAHVACQHGSMLS